jgi:hypothetical protein
MQHSIASPSPGLQIYPPGLPKPGAVRHSREQAIVRALDIDLSVALRASVAGYIASEIPFDCQYHS